MIAEALYDAGCLFQYEKELKLYDDKGYPVVKYPDFTIFHPRTHQIYYWEHCGMLADERYRQRWRAKKAVYEAHGIHEGENLIVSQDEENGSIDCQRIGEFIQRIIG